ncbi:smx5 isoform X1 [Salvelinus fontinalis]|uniref:smx5 isoform X1 n=1 Tax=Salvelinus fontinalis TaxID=8038 RepID=UPI002485C009|nr:smx5 isoform X1 [Salvelinus fontinalis]
MEINFVRSIQNTQSMGRAVAFAFALHSLCSICGTLHSVDQYLNIKLTDISVTDPEKYPHMLSVKNCFIRGSVVRYVQLPADEVDTQLLQDAARKEALQQKQ